MDQFFSIAIVGTLVAFVIEKIKTNHEKEYGPGTGKEIARITAITISVLIGVAFWMFGDTPAWKAFLGILATASVAYDYIIKIAKEE